MPIRPATVADEPAMASLLAAAFFDEPLWGPLIHPYRNEYPEDLDIFWSERLRNTWKTKNARLLVATTTTVDGEEKVGGVAIWERQGDDEGRKKVEEEWVGVEPDAFQPLPAHPNRAIDPSKRTILADSKHHFSHFWSGDRKQNWYLSLCGVDPAHAGKGLGKELVHWGLNRAKEEGVHASCITSQGNDTFYLRCGYDEVVGNCTQGEGNPLNGLAGGDILFMYPV